MIHGLSSRAVTIELPVMKVYGWKTSSDNSFWYQCVCMTGKILLALMKLTRAVNLYVTLAVCVNVCNPRCKP